MPTTLSLHLRRMRRWVLRAALILIAALVPYCVFAQSESASVSGRITDQQNAVIPNAEVELRNVDTNSTHVTKTNGDGIYSFPSLRPGSYVISVRKEQFQTVSVTGVILNVQDNLSRNFVLQVGSSAVSVTVTADQNNINTTDAAVSTVVDRHFAENLPLNGRSFQTLIELTPGVVLTPSTPKDSGQFSINGQRPGSNYWMLDGVSANIGISSSANLGNGLSGSLGSFSVLGNTNSLVSVDAMQEFRIQTSTYAPEFGRAPGGQISIVTRAGTNGFHGTAFDYLRNDALDATNWFNTSVTPALPKAKERQNDFGGTFGGPILKNRTFFFFSYEGLRLRLPQTDLTDVPDAAARASAPAALQPFFNAFPVPNGADTPATGTARFKASYSNPASLDAYSLRVDQNLASKLTLFGRYSYSPSSILQRGNGDALSVVSPSHITTQAGTVGLTWLASPKIANDLRFNYSRTHAYSSFFLDNFGGATPLSSLPFPSGFTAGDAEFKFGIFSLSKGFLDDGTLADNLLRQVNVVDTVTWQVGAHNLKIGTDYRKLAPSYDPQLYSQSAFFSTISTAAAGTLNPVSSLIASRPVSLSLNNVGVFAQDTWRVNRRLTATYGLRWDLDFAPSSTPQFLAVTGYNLKDMSQLALAPVGTSAFKTTYGNVAPRLGVAYQLFPSSPWQTVLRGGVGVFFDLVTQELGNNVSSNSFPFGSSQSLSGAQFPLDAATATPPAITAANLTRHTFSSFDPNLKLPYTLEWNVALDQSLGRGQALSLSYIGAAGRRLLQSALLIAPNPNLFAAQLVTNAATSDYDALQAQFQRRLSGGLQALASYTWSHSIDNASGGSTQSFANVLNPTVTSNANRGPSSFDIRHAFTAGVTYDIPSPKKNILSRAILGGWSAQSLIFARSAPPVDVFDASFTSFAGGIRTEVRPDLVSGQAIYLAGSQYPGGKALNAAAFADPPIDSTTHFPTRQGTLPRNALRGFGASQWDLGVHRNFALHEAVSLQFRAEMFNVLNHPNFAPPSGAFGRGGFGVSTQMLGQSFNSGNLGGGALSPLYQIGGPRSIQLALKLVF